MWMSTDGSPVAPAARAPADRSPGAWASRPIWWGLAGGQGAPGSVRAPGQLVLSLGLWKADRVMRSWAA